MFSFLFCLHYITYFHFLSFFINPSHLCSSVIFITIIYHISEVNYIYLRNV
ncbi:hypothetical protein HMPREF3191_00518 [Veillonellaceae bacterium DNF00626]|nr:hypothetical protein HMPREF3191_00518 [Veillonellaceae bacterium DNF00626]